MKHALLILSPSSFLAARLVILQDDLKRHFYLKTTNHANHHFSSSTLEFRADKLIFNPPQLSG